MSIGPGIRRIFKSLIMNPVSIDRVDYYDPGYLIVLDGRIERLTREDPRTEFPTAEFIELDGFAIVPGFVDTHVHLPQFAIAGIGAESLLDWLNEYTYPEEARFSNPEYAEFVSQRFFDALLLNGTTCAAIYCSIHEEATDIAFQTASKNGMRAFIGKTMMDRNVPPAMLERTDSSIDASVRLHEKWDGANDGRLRYIFTPRFAGACSEELMRRVGVIAKERHAFTQTHLSENIAEVEWIRELFPNYSSYTEVYAASGLLGSNTIAAHCIHLSEAEVSTLARTRTGVAFCPYSNRTLRSGLMPYGRLKQAGLRIGLGSDVAGGPTLSMLRQMGEALNSANAEIQTLTPAGALYLATLGGAEVLGLGEQVGNFAAGRDADFMVLDFRCMDPLSAGGKYNAPEQILSRICFRGDANCVKAVYIQGDRRTGGTNVIHSGS